MTQEIVTALGLVFVIEGLLWAVFPAYGRKLLEAIADQSANELRIAGVVAIAVGVGIVWLVRG